MYKVPKAACLIVLPAVIAGCNTFGENFVRQDLDTLKLGQTTYSQVVQLMGVQKRGSSESWVNDKLVKSLVYSYSPSAISLVHGVTSTPSRSLVFFFYKDVLVAKEFRSSFKSDSTNFDNSKIDQIIKGKTALAEVIQLIGKPNSFSIPPMIKDTSVKEVGYEYTEETHSFNGDIKFFTKDLRISLDDKEIVTNVEFRSGTR